MRTLRFGDMAPKLLEQMPGLDPRFDELADALTLLQINDILTEVETNHARSRLAKQVWRETAIDSVIEIDYISSSLELSKPVGVMVWDDAMSKLYPDGWRMPARTELISLYDETKDSGYEFNDKSPIWSSTSYAPGHNNAWIVNFNNGFSFADFKSKGYVIRLVREVEK